MLTVNSVYDRKITYRNERMEMWMCLCFARCRINILFFF